MNNRRFAQGLISSTLLTVAAAGASLPVAHAEDDLLRSLQSAQVVSLNFIWDHKSPLLSFNPPFLAALVNTHKQTKGWIPQIAFAEDMMYFSGQHGAPSIDALGHISHDGKMFGGLNAEENESPEGLLALGIEVYPKEKYVNRGVLLDVARYKGVDVLEPGYEITAEDLEATAKAEGVEVRPGDSVLIRTGYGKYWGDKAKYMGLRPGPDLSGCTWLSQKKIFLSAEDQLTFDAYPEKGTIFPCHRILIADSGIYIVENMNLEELAPVLAARKNYEFAVVINPPRLRGMTGAAINAFAIVQ